MSETPSVSIKPEIGYRFAGYVDGEGHFAIARRQRPGHRWPTYTCSFALHVRDDDRHVLEAFQREFGGMGHMYEIAARYKPGQTNTKPSAMWAVNTKADCFRLVLVFEEYRLWTKKAGDLHIWAKAVRYLHGPRPEGRAPLERWFNEIRANRAYGAAETPADTEVADEMLMLSLFEDEARFDA